MRIPWFTLLFIIIILLGAIFSTESLFVWMISILFIYRLFTNSKNPNKTCIEKLKFGVINTVIPIIIIYLLNIAFEIGTKIILS